MMHTEQQQGVIPQKEKDVIISNKPDPPPRALKALEFYSGIGGWSEALDLARDRLPEAIRDVEVSE